MATSRLNWIVAFSNSLWTATTLVYTAWKKSNISTTNEKPQPMDHHQRNTVDWTENDILTTKNLPRPSNYSIRFHHQRMKEACLKKSHQETAAESPWKFSCTPLHISSTLPQWACTFVFRNLLPVTCSHEGYIKYLHITKKSVQVTFVWRHFCNWVLIQVE